MGCSATSFASPQQIHHTLTEHSTSDSYDSPNFNLIQAIDDNDENFIFIHRNNFQSDLLTPLIYSIQQLKPNLSKLLLNQANPTYSTTTALIESVKNNFLELAILLLKEVKRTDSNGETALMHAVRNGRNSIIQLLNEEYGMKNLEGDTALVISQQVGNVDAEGLLGVEKVWR